MYFSKFQFVGLAAFTTYVYSVVSLCERPHISRTENMYLVYKAHNAIYANRKLFIKEKNGFQ